jgi:hypothetical protein
VQIGALVYAEVEGWDLRQALQFCVITVATIGYGDSSPKTDAGRAVLFVFFPLGFGIMAYAVNQLWVQLFTKADENVRHVYLLLALYIYKPWMRFRRRRIAQRVAQRRHRVRLTRHASILRREGRIRSLSNVNAFALGGPASPRGAGAGIMSPFSPFSSSPSPPAPAPVLETVREEGAETEMAVLPSRAANASSAAQGSAPASLGPGPLYAGGFDSTPAPGEDEEQGRKMSLLLTPDEAAMHAAAEAAEAAEAAALDAEERAIALEESSALNAMDSLSIDPASTSAASTNYKLALSCAFVLFLLLGGAGLFHRYEPNWTYFESVYFCFCTLTTIGQEGTCTASA